MQAWESIVIGYFSLQNTVLFDHFQNELISAQSSLLALGASPNEALLHYIIALELIFGERQAIQKSVSERVALITFRENSRSFAQQRDWIDAIYDARSRYVHDGTELTDESQLDQLRSLCEQIFRCLMRLQAGHSQLSSRGREALTMWMHELDYLAKGMIAGSSRLKLSLLRHS